MRTKCDVLSGGQTDGRDAAVPILFETRDEYTFVYTTSLCTNRRQIRSEVARMGCRFGIPPSPMIRRYCIAFQRARTAVETKKSPPCRCPSRALLSVRSNTGGSVTA